MWDIRSRCAVNLIKCLVIKGKAKFIAADAVEIEYDGIRIAVNENLRSVSNPAFRVAGDALVTSAQLSPVATCEGRIVSKNIVNSAKKKLDYLVLSSAIYTLPELAGVGLTEAAELRRILLDQHQLGTL